ncbi:unnamed protein product [Fraxinus pennsylvanica]|uniref:RING-type domain-containing protein n=1 Tax=Fraxinus pennsylvanica TaxID=56036 RepID=A0AAD2DXF7_9LAMI|nr:unnamed protein product [Fraxinus pennsylvanica]
MKSKNYLKKVNRSAKLKQCKLDARREQWLSQVKNKANFKEESNGGGMHGGSSVLMEKESIRAIEKLEIKPREVQENYGDGLQLHHYSDSESSPSNSPTSHTSSVLGSSDSRANFTGSSSSSSSRSSSGSSNGCCSESMSEEDEGDDDACLDDWEAMADALAATDDKQQQHNPDSGLDSSPSQKDVYASQSDSRSKVTNQSAFELDISEPERENQGMVAERVLCQAWRPDDACRPQTLPNLSKQYSFPMNSGRHFGCGGSVWACKNVGTVPTSCPICYEDFDFTDSSFLPCSCGFRLCLFCHKRILEEDGRCPGCRKQYDSDTVDGEATQDGGSLTFQLTRSCSMITRS